MNILSSNSESVHLVPFLWFSAIEYNKLSRRSNKSWFILEALQKFRNKRIVSLRMVWSPWQNATYRSRTFPIRHFHSKLRCWNHFEAEYTDYLNLLKKELTTMGPTGIEKYQYPQQKRRQKQMSSVKGFSRWHSNKDIVPTLEAVQKPVAFYHDKYIDVLYFGCTLPNLAIICLHKSNDAKFDSFSEEDNDLVEEFREDDIGGPSFVFTRKAIADETFIRKPTNFCKFFAGSNASQLNSYSMCQPMPTGIYTRWDLDSESGRFTPGQNETRNFQNMVTPPKPEYKTENFYTTERQKRNDCFSVDGFCSYWNTKTFCWVQSKKMFQQICAVSIGRKKAKLWKSKLNCRRINNEASSQQLLRLQDHGPEPKNRDIVLQQRNDTCRYQ